MGILFCLLGHYLFFFLLGFIPQVIWQEITPLQYIGLHIQNVSVCVCAHVNEGAYSLALSSCLLSEFANASMIPISQLIFYYISMIF